ncbi:helix-turn-helix transcriptional regulator [Pantoea sp. B65]|uniref:helix-turn-helix transcriptional regulator n=1 Tax=Pantoea sp. B65 TaxID=2813359 RepID=UPI0039B4AFBD
MMSDTDIVLPKILTRALDQLSQPYFIREKGTTKFIYANYALAKLVGLRSPDSIIGRLDDEISASLFDNEISARLWQQQVRHVVSTQEKISLLEVHPGAVDCPYISKKMPFYNEANECIGMSGTIRYLEVFTPNDFIKGRLPGSLLLTKPDEFFTEKECEIIFFRLQGMNSKDIGNILCLSSRTIENRLGQMYFKAGVNHIDDFRRFCESKELHRYLPKRMLSSKIIGFKNDYKEDISEN